MENEEEKKKRKTAADVATTARPGLAVAGLGRAAGAATSPNPLMRSTPNQVPSPVPTAVPSPAPITPPAGMQVGSVMTPKPQVGVPLRSAVAPAAPAASTPQIPAAMGIAPYVSQARQMTTGMNPNALNRNVPSPIVHPKPPLAAAGYGFGSGEMASAKQSLEQSPSGVATQNVARMQDATSAINRATGSGAMNANLQGMADRSNVVANLQSGKDMSVAGAMRGGATEEQALAMGAQRGTPQVTDAMRAGNALLRGGANVTPRAQAQGMFNDKPDVAKAQAELAKGNNQGKLASETKKVKEAAAGRWKQTQEADKLRRTTDPLALTNIARAQERPAQLEEKRAVREQKAAANRLMRSAMGQNDPRVKAEMVAQASQMARDIAAREPARRTTYNDIVNQQKAQEIAKIAAEGRTAGRAMTDKDVAMAERYRAEADRIRNEVERQGKELSPEDKALLEADLAIIKSSEPDDAERAAAIQRVRDKHGAQSVKGFWDKIGDAMRGVGSGAETSPSAPQQGQKYQVNGRPIEVRNGRWYYVGTNEVAE